MVIEDAQAQVEAQRTRGDEKTIQPGISTLR